MTIKLPTEHQLKSGLHRLVWVYTCQNATLLEITCHSSCKPRDEISNNVVCATSKGSDQPAHTRSLIRAFASRLNIFWLFSYRLDTIWTWRLHMLTFGSRKFCQRGSNFDVFFFLFFFFADEGREDPSATISRPSSARQ